MNTSEEKILDHEFQLRELRGIITDTNVQIKETSKSVSILATNVGKLDVILDRMSSMDTVHYDTNKKIFEKLDNTEKVISNLMIDKASALKDIHALDNRVTSLEGYVTKGVLGVLTAVGMSLMSLVFKG
jgi:hypothetical protein